ncbi:hypothetical protein FB451DRAFT_186098 [Mycena latifolia]|nr:hypothetical protein FB451DRAFT_186098 [Mycena latifolia]
MGDLLYIRFLLNIPWDELWAILRAVHSLMGGRSSEKLSILLKFTLRSTTICSEVYPWPSTCRDVARGSICLLLDQDGLLSDEETAILWAPLVRLSPPCDDLLAHIRNVSPSPKMGGFCIHNVLEWLKPPLEVTERWQRCLEECRRGSQRTSSYLFGSTSRECEVQWTDFRKQMASWHQQEI